MRNNAGPFRRFYAFFPWTRASLARGWPGALLLGEPPSSQCGRRGNPLTVCRRTPPRQHVPPWLPERPCSGKTRAVVTSDPRDDLEPICCRCCQSGVWMMETMPELQEIKSEIGGVDFGAHGGSASTTPQPHQNFQWVSCIFFYHQRFPTSW